LIDVEHVRKQIGGYLSADSAVFRMLRDVRAAAGGKLRI
jgi:hypothetical protein